MKKNFVLFAKLIGHVIAIASTPALFGFTIFLIFGTCSENRKVKNDNPIDSIHVRNQIRKNELVKKFDCDTSILFDISTFTYYKNEILSQLNKTLLVDVEILDINQKNDSIFLLSGKCWDDNFLGNEFIFEIKKKEFSELPKNDYSAYCIIKDFKLLTQRNSSLDSEVHNILIAECVYFEQN